jgi:hypothetical protein
MGVREHLETILEKLAEVRDFAEFLQQRQKSA